MWKNPETFPLTAAGTLEKPGIFPDVPVDKLVEAVYNFQLCTTAKRKKP